jgi:hypothetical protein
LKVEKIWLSDGTLAFALPKEIGYYHFDCARKIFPKNFIRGKEIL